MPMGITLVFRRAGRLAFFNLLLKVLYKMSSAREIKCVRNVPDTFNSSTDEASLVVKTLRGIAASQQAGGAHADGAR